MRTVRDLPESGLEGRTVDTATLVNSVGDIASMVAGSSTTTR